MLPQLKKLKKRIERAGGIMFVSEQLPDEVANLLVDGIASCPLCRSTIGHTSEPLSRATDSGTRLNPTKRHH